MNTTSDNSQQSTERTRSAWEFWPARVFELPYYLALAALCLRYRLPPKQLAKANYALDHGELGLGSKHATQLAFKQRFFPATEFLPDALTPELRREALTAFAAKVGYPVILKPDMGAVGKGIIKVSTPAELALAVEQLPCGYLAQAYVDLPQEYGVFAVRHQGRTRISGINRKHFPSVIGDGRSSIGMLARAHERYTDHWPLFLRYLDLERVPEQGEHVRLSFVGSHTMGCRFTNDSHLATPELLNAIDAFFATQPGYNFGRLDVRALDDQALGRGEFVVIEANGVASLPTHMFDPGHSLWQAYRIFLAHARWLVRIANEHRAVVMPLKPWLELLREVRASARTLNAVHQDLLNSVRKTDGTAASPRQHTD